MITKAAKTPIISFNNNTPLVESNPGKHPMKVYISPNVVEGAVINYKVILSLSMRLQIVANHEL